MEAAVIQVDALTKRFGSLTAVEDVSLSVSSGEVFGLLGPNGAGKSTTIGCLLGQLRPTSGSASIFGFDCWRDRVSAHERIGVLPSDFAFEETLTGREVITLFSRLRGIEFPATRAGELAERLHADLDRPQRELSRGNRQKIGLIQALAHDPELLLMDEPTSGLDPLMQEEFLTIVAELSEAGRTVLLSSHYLEEVERSCERVAMIKGGRLFEIENVDGLLERAPKQVHVTFEGAAPDRSVFTSIAGVEGVEVADNGFAMRVSGSIDPLIKELALHSVDALEVARPSLESTFVALYEGDK
jgi:ABC-2 type transport system ATP-binding protein